MPFPRTHKQSETTWCRLYVPRVQDKEANMHFLCLTDLADLRPVPPFSIMEPTPTLPDGSPREDALEAPGPIEVIIMPGLAFDVQGGRLGRGGGYYDKFIAVCRQRAQEKGWQPPLLAALAFGPQVLDDEEVVPAVDHDAAVDVIVTAAGVMGCTERGERSSCVME
jgi:5-formyltetrahydrofolate cyclo-ligase